MAVLSNTELKVLSFMDSDLCKKDKEIWGAALWFLLALELTSQMIELHPPPGSCGPQFCLRFSSCRMYPTIQLLLKQKAGGMWMRDCAWHYQPEWEAQSSPWLLKTPRSEHEQMNQSQQGTWVFPCGSLRVTCWNEAWAWFLHLETLFLRSYLLTFGWLYTTL